MENLVDIPINTVLEGIEWQSVKKYENISSDVIIRLKDNELKIVHTRTFWDYLLSFFFFILRVLFLVSLPVIIIAIFWFSFSNFNKKSFIPAPINSINNYVSTLDNLLVEY